MFCFGEEIFFGQIWSKKLKWKFNNMKMKVRTKTNSNILNSIVMLICPVLNGKHPFWARFLKKISAFSVIRRLIASLIRIHWIRWSCSFALLWTRNTLSRQIWRKKINFFLLKLEFRIETNSNNSLLGTDISFLHKSGLKMQNSAAKMKLFA